VRLSHAHPLAIAVWRLGFSLGIIAIFLIATNGWRQWRTLTLHDWLIALGAGVLLAIHFWSWNASVALTTVAASVLLVNTQPVVSALLSALWLREPPSRAQWFGIGVAMLGAFVVVVPDLAASGGAHPLLGDALALIGAVTAAIYFVSGRRLRAKLDLWPYVAIVYGACFVSLLVFAAIVRAPVAPQPPRELAIFLGLAVGPMLLGHTGMNWALRYLPAYAVNVTLLGEPVGAALLAAILPGIRELPGMATVLGGLLVLAGIYVTTRRS
jgi:drug/metabolite transporter (DMT)-like permease